MKPLSQNEPWLTWIDNLGLLAAKALPFLIDVSPSCKLCVVFTLMETSSPG